MTPYDNDIAACLQVLHAGGLLLYPTDTIWGIGCDATNATAVEKVYRLKQRASNKSMIVLLAEERSLINYVTQPDPLIFDYIKGISKPTTVIYEGATGLAGNLVGDDGSVAIRIVKDDFCRHLIKCFSKPLVSTSANVSGYPSPTIFDDIDVVIKNGVDYIVQYRQDDQHIAAPSAIIKWNKNGLPTIIRH